VGRNAQGDRAASKARRSPGEPQNSKTTPYDYFVRSAETAAKSLAIELVPSPVENAADIERVLAAFAGVPNGGLLVLPSGTTTLHRDLVIALAARYRLPAVYPFRFYVKAGGLMSYSTDLVDQSRQAASYVDRILRGANPTELPVQAPIKYGVFADHSGSFFALRGNG